MGLKSHAATTPASFFLWPLTPPSPFFALSRLLHTQGILGFVDDAGNLLICPHGTIPQEEEDTHQHIAYVPPPPNSHLFVYSIAKRLCSSKAWCIYTAPPPHLFLYNLNEKRKKTGHWELCQSHKVLFDALVSEQRRTEERGDDGRMMTGLPEKIKLYISEKLNFARTLRVWPCMTQRTTSANKKINLQLLWFWMFVMFQVLVQLKLLYQFY